MPVSFPEDARELVGVVVTDLRRDRGYAEAGLGQQAGRARDAQANEIAVRRQAGRLLEGAVEVKHGELGETGELRVAHVVGEVGLEVLPDARELETGETAAPARRSRPRAGRFAPEGGEKRERRAFPRRGRARVGFFAPLLAGNQRFTARRSMEAVDWHPVAPSLEEQLERLARNENPAG